MVDYRLFEKYVLERAIDRVLLPSYDEARNCDESAFQNEHFFSLHISWPSILFTLLFFLSFILPTMSFFTRAMLRATLRVINPSVNDNP